MIAFPQLLSGAMAQLPLERESRFRVRRNETRDGGTIQIGDPDFEERRWDLRFRELTDPEWTALEGLFAASKGRFGAFTFLEPGANLLAWSEELTLGAWQSSGSVTGNQPDPFGGSAATTLAAGASVSQTIAAPSDYRYTGSAWLRSSGAGSAIRIGDGAANTFEQAVPATGQWTRLTVAYQAASSTDAMQLELVSGAASSLEVFGAQMEPQPAASAYKKSASQGGVFPNTRFDQDILVDEATGPGRHSTRIRLLWTPLQS